MFAAAAGIPPLAVDDKIRQTALAKLSREPSQESLWELIRWLDVLCRGASFDSLSMQTLVRAVIAAGRGFVTQRAFPRNHPVARTLRAAEEFSLAPTEAKFDRYFDCATDSYPFGTGEGCYAVKELGYAGCEPGSGCGSGAGTLDQIAQNIGAAAVMALIAAEVIPWLNDEADPIAERVGST
jgi:hypothetical protein